MGRLRSGQSQQTVNLSDLVLRWFKSIPAHHFCFAKMVRLAKTKFWRPTVEKAKRPEKAGANFHEAAA